MFNFSALFTGALVSASFDAAISTDAANGRVNAAFITALDNAYGLQLPASPKSAIGYINSFVGAEKAPTVGKGPGARTGARDIAQALHALGAALHAGGAAKGLPTLAALAAWADPAALAAAKAAKAAAKPAIVKEDAPDNLPTAKAAHSALALVRAALAHGVFTASECDALVALVATCQRAAEPAKAKAKATHKAAAPAKAAA